MKNLSLSLFSVAILLFLPNLSYSNENIIFGKAKVIDGDTIKIKSKKIRLFGIDAPEQKQKCKKIRFGFFIFNFQKEYKCGFDATNFLKTKIQNKNIKCIINSKDRYKRLISICYKDKIDINSWMVKNGQAIAYRKYSKKYILDEEYAQKEKLGIWQGSFMRPEKWRRIMN